MGYHSVDDTELEDRMIALIETAPLIDLTPNQIDDLSEELRDYHRIYSPLFVRREQAQWAEKYMQGFSFAVSLTFADFSQSRVWWFTSTFWTC